MRNIQLFATRSLMAGSFLLCLSITDWMNCSKSFRAISYAGLCASNQGLLLFFFNSFKNFSVDDCSMAILFSKIGEILICINIKEQDTCNIIFYQPALETLPQKLF